MTSYKLSVQAKDDLQRIYLYGLERYGEKKAEQYFHAFFEQLDVIAESPYRSPSVDDVRPGYRRSVCGADSVYFRVISGVVEVMAVIGRQGFTSMD